MKYLEKSILKTKKRKKRSHKGDFGRVLVVAGSEDFLGANVLTANACKAILRSGADLAIACCPEKVAWIVNSQVPEVITKKFRGKYFSLKHLKKVIEMSKDKDVLLIGPGLGRKAIPFAKKIIERIKLPKVIDADAIYASDLRKISNSVFTPHIKEFEALLKNSNLTRKNFRKHLGNNVILLKGVVDKIISKDKIAYNKTGNPVMTKGGTGDVLAGLCAGFLAQGNSLFKSACMAAYLNGKTGDLLLKEKGKTFLALDIIENIHRVMK